MSQKNKKNVSDSDIVYNDNTSTDENNEESDISLVIMAIIIILAIIISLILLYFALKGPNIPEGALIDPERGLPATEDR